MTNAKPLVVVGALLMSLLGAVALLIACSEDKTNPVRPAIQPNFVDAEYDLGYQCVCWDQFFGEQRAAAGKYTVRMVAGTYDNTWNFWIATGAPPVRPSECCDTSTIAIPKPLKDPPEFFGLTMDADTFRVNDTIFFEFALPREARLQVEIRPAK